MFGQAKAILAAAGLLGLLMLAGCAQTSMPLVNTPTQPAAQDTPADTNAQVQALQTQVAALQARLHEQPTPRPDTPTPEQPTATTTPTPASTPTVTLAFTATVRPTSTPVPDSFYKAYLERQSRAKGYTIVLQKRLDAPLFPNGEVATILWVLPEDCGTCREQDFLIFRGTVLVKEMTCEECDLKIDDQNIVIDAAKYADSDPMCCPSQRTTELYRWDGRTFVSQGQQAYLPATPAPTATPNRPPAPNVDCDRPPDGCWLLKLQGYDLPDCRSGTASRFSWDLLQAGGYQEKWQFWCDTQVRVPYRLDCNDPPGLDVLAPLVSSYFNQRFHDISNPANRQIIVDTWQEMCRLQERIDREHLVQPTATPKRR
jgi:hypothetical protein